MRTAHTLTLEGDIGVNFYYYLPARYKGEKALAFVYKGQPKEGLLEETTNYGYTYKTTYTVAAKEMSEPITATLSSDGTVINEHDYSVMRYANLALQNPKSFKPELLDLAKSMLYYGACAQQYFDYNLDNLAEHYYGRPDYYWIIADFNRIQDPLINLWEHYKKLKVPVLSNIVFEN